LTSTPPYQTTTHTYATTPRKISKKKIPPSPPLITPTKKIAKFPPQIPFLLPSEKSNQFGCHPSKKHFWKNIKMHTTLKPKVSIVM